MHEIEVRTTLSPNGESITLNLVNNSGPASEDISFKSFNLPDGTTLWDGIRPLPISRRQWHEGEAGLDHILFL